MYNFRIIVAFTSFLPAMALGHCDFANKLSDRAAVLENRGQYLMAGLHFSQAAAVACGAEEQNENLYKYAKLMIKLNEDQEALRQLETVQRSAGEKLKSKVSLLKSLHFEVDASLGDFDKSRLAAWRKRELTQIKELNPFHQKIHRHYQKQVEGVSLKSPALAGTMSLVPGLGQVYTGNYESALVAFVVNSIFYFTYKDFKDNNLHGPANASLLVLSVTYVGNILNAANSANLKNKAAMAPVESDYRQALFGDL